VRTRAYRFSGGIPAFPARWFYGLFRALPGERAFLPPSPRDILAKLDASIAAPGPHDFAVRVSHARQSQLSRPPHLTRAFVTCATPLSSGETGEFKSVICPTAKAEYFCAKVWTDFW
jgi:hypothetical protein